jgi:predicted transposase YdaD
MNAFPYAVRGYRVLSIRATQAAPYYRHIRPRSSTRGTKIGAQKKRRRLDGRRRGVLERIDELLEQLQHRLLRLVGLG